MFCNYTNLLKKFPATQNTFINIYISANLIIWTFLSWKTISVMQTIFRICHPLLMWQSGRSKPAWLVKKKGKKSWIDEIWKIYIFIKKWPKVCWGIHELHKSSSLRGTWQLWKPLIQDRDDHLATCLCELHGLWKKLTSSFWAEQPPDSPRSPPETFCLRVALQTERLSEGVRLFFPG